VLEDGIARRVGGVGNDGRCTSCTVHAANLMVLRRVGCRNASCAHASHLIMIS